MPELQGGINTLIQLAPPADNGNTRRNAVEAGVGAYVRNLTSIVGIARAHGVQPVFVTFLDDPNHRWAQEESSQGIAGFDLAVKDRHGARGEREKAGEGLERGGLTGAVRADQAEQLAGGELHAQPRQRNKGAVFNADVDCIQDNRHL